MFVDRKWKKETRLVKVKESLFVEQNEIRANFQGYAKQIEIPSPFVAINKTWMNDVKMSSFLAVS